MSMAVASAAQAMAASLVSAYIQCTDPDLPLPPINFAFNPEGYTVITKAHWERSPQPASPAPPQWQGIERADAGRQDPAGRLRRTSHPADGDHRAAQAAGAADRPFRGRRGGHGTDRDVWLGHQHHHGPGRGDEGLGRRTSASCSGCRSGPPPPSPWRRFRCRPRLASPTRPRAGWRPGAPGPWWRATPWRRSPTRNTRTPTNGGRWPRPTTSTIRCASSPGSVLIVPDRRDAEALL